MKLYIKILIHFIFWVVFLGVTIATVFSNKLGIEPESSFPHVLINTLWAAAIFYLFYFRFIAYFEKGKFMRYLFISIVSSVVITFLFIPLHMLFLSEFDAFNYLVYLPPMIGTFILAQCGSLVRGFENWVDNIKLKAELETRNLKNELELLKSQINPHFLFNTLNNIDALIHKSPDDASRSLLNLSDMLRYMIYETNASFVSLEKEIEYLEHYIKLQKLRLRETEFVNYTFLRNCKGAKIAPVLFLPFVENAFKHASNEGKLPVIAINLRCDESEVIFECSNSYKTDAENTIQQGGVGLENVRRRLKLIYPGRHNLSILKENNIFKVALKINYSKS